MSDQRRFPEKISWNGFGKVFSVGANLRHPGAHWLTDDPGRRGWLAYCGYGAWRTRRARFLSFALYGLLHIGLLIPVRVRALATLTDDRWGERGASARPLRDPGTRPARGNPSRGGRGSGD